MAPFASRLSQTAPTWAHLVAPIAEWFAREIGKSGRVRQPNVPTRLTQRYKREAKGGDPPPKMKPIPLAKRICPGCGKEIEKLSNSCKRCLPQVERIDEIARIGRAAAHSREAEAARSATQKANRQAIRDWELSDQADWLTEAFYKKQIQPILASTSVATIAKQLTVSVGYADQIRKRRLPHPRHWKALAELAGPQKLDHRLSISSCFHRSSARR